ncbi:MAG: biotin--protein ligase [Deltaproteobacteria bacterium]|nr:biotin--protein ligase [Deltaproteobacteria bacterium]
MPDFEPALIHILWDESHLWGLMLRHAAEYWKWPAAFVTAAQVAEGILDRARPRVLIVPGGWAALKARSLGQEGRKAIRRYVDSGGKYLGFCGGAGLALSSISRSRGLDLCPWGRRAMAERLPNFSGHVLCRILPNGPSSPGEATLSLPVWWPSQFAPKPEFPVEVLAVYETPENDFMAADVWTDRIDQKDLPAWEALYGINMDPAMLVGEPCVIRGRFGRGLYVLSYPHLETPASPQANALLSDLLADWTGLTPGPALPEWRPDLTPVLWPDPALEQGRILLDTLVDFGRDQFLLRWRRPWLLNWRRGIPGSALTALWVMNRLAMAREPGPAALAYWTSSRDEFLNLMTEFQPACARYLALERLSLAAGPSSPERSASAAVQNERERLFGCFPGYGGIYGDLLRLLDGLHLLLTTENGSKPA